MNDNIRSNLLQIFFRVAEWIDLFQCMIQRWDLVKVIENLRIL